MRPWQIAALRAVIGGVSVGLLTFFGVWATTNDLKSLLIAFNTPFWGIIVQRGVAEGWWDTVK